MQARDKRVISTLSISRRAFLSLAASAGLCALWAGLPGQTFADETSSTDQSSDSSTTTSDERWSAYGDDYPSVTSCSEAAIVDGDGNTLFSLNGSRSMAMASTTKIMTATVALESGIPLSTTYTVTNVIETVYGQLVGFTEGQQTTLNDLVHALLIYSGNDAAVCIAECVGGSVDNFVYMMNQKAQELGMSGTHYTNPHGLDEDGHYSTPLDLITLARHATQIPTFSTIVNSEHVTVTAGGEQKTLESTDALTNSYPGMRGVKTGYTYAAGLCFVGRCTRGGKTFFTAVLGGVDSEGRWQDTRNMLDWAYSHYPESQSVLYNNLTSYTTFSDNMGWVVSSRLGGSVAFRDGQSRTAVSSGSISGIADVGENTASVSWTGSDGAADATRTSKAEGVVFKTHNFGPLNSSLFY